MKRIAPVFFAFALFLISCGGEPAQSKETKQISEVTTPTAPEKVLTASVNTSPPTKSEMTEVVEEVIEKAEIEERDYNAENIENPAPVKIKEKPLPVKKPKPAVVQTVKETITETPPSAEVESPKVAAPAPAPVKETVKEVVKEVKETPPPAPAFNHDAWDQLLRKYVSSSGKVNYKSFKADEAKLDAYLKALQDNPLQSSWSKSKKMAYWINAYNAFTIKLILKNHPVGSITDLHGGKPWDVKWIKLGGKTYSLNNIENDILRPQYKDARIHFAVNCAAKSCPPVLNRAWTASNLNSNLEKQAKSFINNGNYNQINSDKIEISKIFDWYSADFGNIIDFLNKYSKTKIEANAKVTYREYNWKLNN